ncbi:hypothetical protein CEXT_654651 [Caerostris extrusa]|uniref:Uncharacterized protein n=1 Tax=Caerostris extrusa TaxID=172846 RepID=A0AAV4PKH8_CAEEX|nr:hypothetical protein CEXT_654651 [Caerostris extrusa]
MGIRTQEHLNVESFDINVCRDPKNNLATTDSSRKTAILRQSSRVAKERAEMHTINTGRGTPGASKGDSVRAECRRKRRIDRSAGDRSLCWLQCCSPLSLSPGAFPFRDYTRETIVSLAHGIIMFCYT